MTGGMMFKGTPGPCVIEGNDLFGKEDGYTVHVAEIHMNDDENQFSRENAHLIAAAPELMEALIGIIDSIGPDGYIPSCGLPKTQAARAAIAKALGEQK